MKENDIRCIAGQQNMFSSLADLFVQEPDTEIGPGVHYLVDLVGTGLDGLRVVTIVCENHEIPIRIFREHVARPVRDMVNDILLYSPVRCALILDIRDNELLQKVRMRIARKRCDLRFRRVIFCLVDHDMPSGSSRASFHFPGSFDDRKAMLLYHVPDRFRPYLLPDSLEALTLALDSYNLFEYRRWRHVTVDGTLEQFVSSAMHQMVSRTRSDPGLVEGEYPSFEMVWRSVFATRLLGVLCRPPMALCPGIHRVIPIGVSSTEALEAVRGAIPREIQDPYAITVQSAAVDERGGSIAITHPMGHTVVPILAMR